MKKLFILSGGPGRERKVSLSSGWNVMELLGENDVLYESVIVEPDKTWNYKENTLTEQEGIELLKKEDALVFQIIHGTYGEDGELVTLLEENSIPFVGSSSASMQLTIDKYKTEQKLIANGISTTRSVIVDSVSDMPTIEFSFPVMVKPKDEGSSVALFKVKTNEDLKVVIEKTVPVYGAMLVQEFVTGREFTCGVVEIGGQIQALFPTEVILTKGETFDYEAKYTAGGSKEVTPAGVGPSMTKKIQDLAKQVHTVCGCKDISRTDMILNDKGELVVLEINTVPGMTKTSFIPAQLQASGYDIIQFIDGMIEKYTS